MILPARGKNVKNRILLNFQHSGILFYVIFKVWNEADIGYNP